jgi:Carbon-nitrogen hydrolase
MIFCRSKKSGLLHVRIGLAACATQNYVRRPDMSGLGGLNKSPEGVVIGLVQLQLPVVVTKTDLARQTERIVTMVGKARRNLGTMDLVVFPEYSLHGLSMDTNTAIMCSLDGPEVLAFKKACIDNKIWGCFSIMELNPDGNPYNSGPIINDHGEIKLYYRKFHPWIPAEPWEPGDIGIPVIEGPKGALGRREQHLPALAPRLCRGERRRDGLSLHLHAGHGRRHLPATVGGSGQGHRRHIVRLPGADARVWGEGGKSGGMIAVNFPADEAAAEAA